MRRLGIACFLGSIVAFGCSHPNSNIPVQWDTVADGSAQIYSVNGQIFTHRQFSADKAVTAGTNPAIADSENQNLFVNAHRVWYSDTTMSKQVPISKPSADQEDRLITYDDTHQRVFFLRYTDYKGSHPNGYDLYSCNIDGGNLEQDTSLNFAEATFSVQACNKTNLYFIGRHSEKGAFTADTPQLISLSLDGKKTLAPVSLTASPATVNVNPAGDTLLITTTPDQGAVSAISYSLTKKSETPLKLTFKENPKLLLTSDPNKILYLVPTPNGVDAYTTDLTGLKGKLFSISG